MKIITDFSELDLNATYSYSDYMLWKFDERVELIKGKIFKMSPAPNVKHQKISVNMTRLVSNHFYKTPCQFFHAPFDVRLEDSVKVAKKSKNTTTVVQPDICVICDVEKLDEKGCIGAPDWVIEIVSPSTADRDLKVKKRLYAENGVREYWVIFPHDRVILGFGLNEKNEFDDIDIQLEPEVFVPKIFPELRMISDEIFD